MYHTYFGQKRQLVFPTKEDFYSYLGFLAKADISLVYEYNEDTGSWGNAGRICFYTARVARCFGKIAYREGRGSNLYYRINCNDFVENIVRDHAFVYGRCQNVAAIRNTVPDEYKPNFDIGYNW